MTTPVAIATNNEAPTATPITKTFEATSVDGICTKIKKNTLL